MGRFIEESGLLTSIMVGSSKSLQKEISLKTLASTSDSAKPHQFVIGDLHNKRVEKKKAIVNKNILVISQGFSDSCLDDLASRSIGDCTEPRH